MIASSVCQPQTQPCEQVVWIAPANYACVQTHSTIDMLQELLQMQMTECSCQWQPLQIWLHQALH